MKLPSDPLLSAIGSINASYRDNEVGLSANNPAVLQEGLSSKINTSFNNFIGGIKAYSLTGALQNEHTKTMFGAHIYFVDYGNISQTDAAGNVLGSFRPVDYVVQVSAARKYLERWNYGVAVKLIGSKYQQFKSAAVAFDFGLIYEDSANHITAGILAKNMGIQIKSYGGNMEDLPFDIQIGITKKLANAPLAFSITAQHIHQFNILYNDSTINGNNLSGTGFFNKLFNHLVIASHIYISQNLELNIGYNQLRRSELSLGTSNNGLAGFSAGFRVIFQKIEILYTRTTYQKNISYNHFGLEIPLHQFFSSL